MMKDETREVLNLEGVACPQNSAMTLLKLESMETGALLEIVVDDGEPIMNVPLSLETEVHEIISKVKTDKIWKILVRKS
ncbi:MAG: sulfurtransferase TusA family protein [Candidatus Omnitrophota bacterium]